MQIPFAAPAASLPGTVPVGDRTSVPSASAAGFARLFDQSVTVGAPRFAASEPLSEPEDCDVSAKDIVPEDNECNADVQNPADRVEIASLPLSAPADDSPPLMVSRQLIGESGVADDSLVTTARAPVGQPFESLALPRHEPRGQPFLQGMAAEQPVPVLAKSFAVSSPFLGIAPQVARLQEAEVVQIPIVPPPMAAPGEEPRASVVKGAMVDGLTVARAASDSDTAAAEKRAFAPLAIAQTVGAPDRVDKVSDVSPRAANLHTEVEAQAAVKTDTSLPPQGTAPKMAVPPVANPSVAMAQRTPRPIDVPAAATRVADPGAGGPHKSKANSVVAAAPLPQAVADTPSRAAQVIAAAGSSGEAVTLGARERSAQPPDLFDVSQTGFGPGQSGQVRDPILGTALPTDAGPQRPQTPLLAQHVAQQLAVSLRQSSDRVTEMALDPVELGKVRMTVRAQDQAIVMTVIADRPETADLMRRHVDVLQQEFRALGYTSVTLDFSAGQGQSAFDRADRGGEGAHDGAAPGDATIATDTSDIEPAVTARGPDGSLDLRL